MGDGDRESKNFKAMEDDQGKKWWQKTIEKEDDGDNR